MRSLCFIENKRNARYVPMGHRCICNTLCAMQVDSIEILLRAKAQLLESFPDAHPFGFEREYLVEFAQKIVNTMDSRFVPRESVTTYVSGVVEFVTAVSKGPPANISDDDSDAEEFDPCPPEVRWLEKKVFDFWHKCIAVGHERKEDIGKAVDGLGNGISAYIHH
jgi:hypothetical protein